MKGDFYCSRESRIGDEDFLWAPGVNRLAAPETHDSLTVTVPDAQRFANRLGRPYTLSPILENGPDAMMMTIVQGLSPRRPDDVESSRSSTQLLESMDGNGIVESRISRLGIPGNVIRHCDRWSVLPTAYAHSRVGRTDDHRARVKPKKAR